MAVRGQGRRQRQGREDKDAIREAVWDILSEAQVGAMPPPAALAKA